MNVLIRLAALAGVAWLIKQPTRPTTFAVGARVRVVGYRDRWDGTTGTITHRDGPFWRFKVDTGGAGNSSAGFSEKYLEVIS